MKLAGKTMLALLSLAAALNPYFVLAINVGQAANPDQLQQQIQDRAKQLDALNQAIQQTQNNLKDVQQQKNTLQTQVKTLDYSIKQIDLNIQADTVSAQKVTYEIGSLNYDIRDIEMSIENKKDTIAQLFRELQKVQGKSTLMLFLENKTLAEGLSATQSLDDLRAQLATDIGDLNDLKSKNKEKLDNLGQKKTELTYHQENLKNRKQIAEDTKQERGTLLAQTKNKESVYQKQVADLLRQQQDIANEIEALDAALRSKVDPKFLPPISSGVLGWPVKDGKALETQGYGATSFAKNGYKGKWHNGVDFGVPIGTPIFAAEDGTVLATGNQDSYCYRGAYGKFILIKHTNNLTTLYGHLSKYIVSPGQAVKRGEVIGYSGKTGYATGPHLHFTVFATPTIPPAANGYAEGMRPSKTCGPMPYGGDLNPLGYL